MKRIIEVDEETYNNCVEWQNENRIKRIIASGIPYDTSGDLISRETLLEAIRKRLGISSLKYLTEQEKVIVEEIDNAPSVSFMISPDYVTELQNLNKELIKQLEEVERPQGEWIDYSDEGYIECPFCGQATTCEDNIDELHYCWNCGADMRKGEEE